MILLLYDYWICTCLNQKLEAQIEALNAAGCSGQPNRADHNRQTLT